jgi:hypothetical protein
MGGGGALVAHPESAVAANTGINAICRERMFTSPKTLGVLEHYRSIKIKGASPNGAIKSPDGAIKSLVSARNPIKRPGSFPPGPLYRCIDKAA